MPADQIAKLRALLPDEDGCATGAVAAGTEWCRECGTADALRNAAPELLAVAEAARAAVWEQTENLDAHRAHEALARALDALDAKLAEVLP